MGFSVHTFVLSINIILIQIGILEVIVYFKILLFQVYLTGFPQSKARKFVGCYSNVVLRFPAFHFHLI